MTDSKSVADANTMSQRFRGYLPVVVDVETGGLDAEINPLLEVAAVLLEFDADGVLAPVETHRSNVLPFEGSVINPKSVEINGIQDPEHPLRAALNEKEALQSVFLPIREAVKRQGCQRAVLVGHNPAMDLAFVNAAARRANLKRNPFHPFSAFDTATLGALAYGQTVLARCVSAAGLTWDAACAHSAIYDAEQTAALFCGIVNRWRDLGGWTQEAKASEAPTS